MRTSSFDGEYDAVRVGQRATEHDEAAVDESLWGDGAALARTADVTSPNPDVAPVIDHGYRTDPHDVAAPLEGIEGARELAATEPLRALVGAELMGVTRPSKRQSAGRTCTTTTRRHLQARRRRRSARRLRRPWTAPRPRPDRRRDCSLMPVVPRASTNVPAVVVGERIADELLA